MFVGVLLFHVFKRTVRSSELLIWRGKCGRRLPSGYLGCILMKIWVIFPSFFLSFFFFLGELVFLHVHFRWKMGKIKLVLASIPNLLLFSEKGFCWAGDFILFIFFNSVKNFKISPCGWSRFSFLLFKKKN